VTAVDFSSVAPGVRGRPGDDPIFALHTEAVRRAAAGESILNSTLGTLATEDGRLAVLPSVAEAFLRAQGSVASGYAPVSGTPAFLDAVIADLFGEGSLAGESVAVATPGGTGAVYQAVLNFLEPGQKILTTHYHWGPYPAIARNSGRDFDAFPMFDAGGGFHVEALSAAVDRHIDTQGRALVVLNFPCHNPTGYSLGHNEWRRATEVLRSAGERAPVTVLFDVAYFRFGGPAATAWIAAIPELLKSTTVLVAWTASKTFTQYGARVGALVGLHRDEEERTQIRNALGFTCRSTWSTSNHAGQRAITELLVDPALRGQVDAEREALITLLSARIRAFNEAATVAGLRTPRFDSGFFITVFTRDGERTAAAMRDDGVFVLPVKDSVRVALCSTPKSAIPRMVDALVKGVAAAG